MRCHEEREAKKRKVHSPEFKAKVGLEALRGVKTINEIGQEYGVHPVQVGQWKKEIQEQAKTLFEGKRGPAAGLPRQSIPPARSAHNNHPADYASLIRPTSE